jgi:hypothetical protein
VIPDFTVRLWELTEYEPTSNNIQYIRYPIQNMDYIASVTNGTLKEWTEGTEFNIADGGIEWIAGQEPTYDNVAENGEVFTISYYAYPVYVVLQNIRELRVTQELVNGQKVSRRLPQQIQVRRDFLANANDRKRNA